MRLKERGLAITPEIKWTITFGSLLALLPLGVIINIIYKEWVKNREKFENEYSKMFKQIQKVRGTVEYLGITKLDIGIAKLSTPLTAFGVSQTRSTYISSIKNLINNNPKKIEDGLIKDWEKTNSLMDQLWREYQLKRLNPNNFSKNRFYTKQKKALKKIKWLESKVKNYYMCHTLGRWKYRITVIPAIVKSWFE